MVRSRVANNAGPEVEEVSPDAAVTVCLVLTAVEEVTAFIVPSEELAGRQAPAPLLAQLGALHVLEALHRVLCDGAGHRVGEHGALCTGRTNRN